MADAKISALNAKTTVHDTDLFPMVDIEAETDETKKITGANLKSQVLAGHKDLTTGVHGAGANTLLHSGSTDVIGGAQLTQVFGASSTRLRNLIISPIAGEVIRISYVTSDSPFSGSINAGGSGGLTATNVPYDGDSNEDMFNGLSAYNGSNFWGHIILHNTTRSNSREIVSVDRVNNVITTTSSTDDWADDDVITVQSQTNTTAGYFDVEMSDFVNSNMAGLILKIIYFNGSASATDLRCLRVHPFEERNVGKEFECFGAIAGEITENEIFVSNNSNKITCMLKLCTIHYVAISVIGWTEYADT